MINRITNQNNALRQALGLKIILLSIVLLVGILPFASAAPVVSIYNPTGTYNYNKVGDNLLLSFNVTNSLTQSSWYSYGGVNTSVSLTGGGIINTHGYSLPASDSATSAKTGEKIYARANTTLVNAVRNSAGNGTMAYLTNSTLDQLANTTFVGNTAIFNYPLVNGTTYYLLTDSIGVNYKRVYNNSGIVYPYNFTDVDLITGYSGGDSASEIYTWESIVTGVGNYSGVVNITLGAAKILTVYANDTTGNTGSASRSWDYKVFENYRTYNSNVYSTSTETFILNANVNYSSSLIAYLVYNGTSYSSSVAGSNNVTLTNILSVPSISSETNLSFYWSLVIDGTTTVNTTVSNQTLSSLSFGLCSGALNVNFINFTTKSAENPFPILNTTFKTSWDIATGLGGSTSSYTFEDVTEANSTWRFCSAFNQSLYVSAHIEYDASGYAQNSYYLLDALLTNVSQLISLYTLNDSKATITVLKAIDNAQTPIEDVTISIQLYDVGTGTFYTVGMARTDFKGEDIAYLNWYDSLYRFVLVKDGTVLLSTNTTRISSTPVTFDITSATSFLFEKFLNFQYSLSFNNVTNNFVLTFVKPSGLVEQGCLRVIKRTGKNDTEVCLTCESSSSATVYCNVNAYGNGTYIAHFYATGSFYDLDWIVQTIGATFSDTIYDLLGSSDASFYAFIFGGIVTFMFFVHPVFGVIGSLLGVIGASALGFAPINYLTFVGIALIGGVIIWIIKR